MPAAAPAVAPTPASTTPTFGFGSTNNASAGVPGGIFSPPAVSSSPFGTVTGFGAAKPPGIGGGGSVFGQVCAGESPPPSSPCFFCLAEGTGVQRVFFRVSVEIFSWHLSIFLTYYCST